MKKENKLLSAISSITSGILTSIVYDELSSSYYQKEIIGDEIEIFVQIEEISLASRIIIIAITFLLIWLILSFLVPRFLYFIKSIRNKREHVITTKNILNVYNTVKERVKSIYWKTNGNFSVDYNLLYSDELAECINTLYCVFCPSNKRQINTVKATFRSSMSIHTKAVRISPYELRALLSTIEDLLSIVMTSSDKNCTLDKDKLKNKIEEIKTIIPQK